MKPFSQGIRGKRVGEAKTAPPPVLPLLRNSAPEPAPILCVEWMQVRHVPRRLA
jgi:hypothetical protein